MALRFGTCNTRCPPTQGLRLRLHARLVCPNATTSTSSPTAAISTSMFHNSLLRASQSSPLSSSPHSHLRQDYPALWIRGSRTPSTTSLSNCSEVRRSSPRSATTAMWMPFLCDMCCKRSSGGAGQRARLAWWRMRSGRSFRAMLASVLGDLPSTQRRAC